MDVLTVGLFPNTKKENINTVVNWIIQYLQDRNVKVLLPEGIADDLCCAQLGCNLETIRSQITIGIALGGDGTLLSMTRKLACAGIPVLGINMGKLGFLAEVELPEIAQSLDKIIAGSYTIEERLMLDAVVVRNGESLQISSALNDVVITKGSFSRVIKLRLCINGEFTTDYLADGIILASATGSTGYSLSAGGPIVNPELKVTVITPICPHTLHARPLIISDKDEISISMLSAPDEIMLTVDGQVNFKLQANDQVVVKAAKESARFIRLGEKSYYEILRTKLWRDDSNADI